MTLPERPVIETGFLILRLQNENSMTVLITPYLYLIYQYIRGSPAAIG
jgi:hypothetical protein